jgi:hypothetical protein
MTLSCCLARLSQETLPSVLFAKPPVVRFIPEEDTCHCGERLLVQKTRRKRVLTMVGPFIAHEKITKCAACSDTFHSDSLLRLVASRCNVAYDVLVFVGHALFQQHRNSREVRAELITRNIRLSISEIEYLGRKFVTYLALAHRQAMPRIRQAMELAGGYVLHLDATHEGEAPALMTGMDGLSKFVLANIKLPSENADHIVPFLQRLKSDYGTPRACVHDMGAGILKAVAQVFPEVPDFICHFHFLRDIGKDFLGPAYSELRKHLRSHSISSRLHALARDVRQPLVAQRSKCEMLAEAIQDATALADNSLMPIATTYSLARWVLHGKHSGDGYGFPFDRPHLGFAERLLELYTRLPLLLALLLTDEASYDGQTVWKLAREVSCVANDSELCQAVEELRWRSQVFDRLRSAMRIAPLDSGNGLNDEGEEEDLSTIRQGVEKFRLELEKDSKLAVDPLARKMAEQIDKYKKKLFADPIKVDTPNGPITICPQRTNNILEQFFRGERQAYRRKTGNDSMCRTLQAMLADTPLVRNLDNPNYMKILLDGKTNLEELFAELGKAHHQYDDGLQTDTDRILPGFRALMSLPTLPEQIVRSLIEQVKVAKSN